MSPITDCLKHGEFTWTKAATKAFKEVKREDDRGTVMRLPSISPNLLKWNVMPRGHGSWVDFLQRYYFVVKHRAGVENKAADALSRRVSLLSVMSVKVTGFERLKDDYQSCQDFGELYTSLSNASHPVLDDYSLQDGYLFKANKLCIPRSSVRDFLVWEIHAGGLAGHFGQDKTIEEVECQFYWPGLKRGVAKIVGQCRTCQLAKHRKQNTGLYTPLHSRIARGRT
ncbi:uncharacterized protein LOC142644153 [Castanea sativa]|uniref:uncharacterized protein LOC142644153 n=1 Tax=Castanea sativa TaxID=21020 RepID=UPI003F64D84E